MKKNKYLVTGGSGFIGSYLVKRLLKEGHSVVVLDNLVRGRVARLDSVIGDIEFITADIRDEDKVSKICTDIDCIYHLAAINGTENFYTQSELVLDIGIRGMLSIMNACQKNNVSQLIVASSAEVYQTPLKIPTDETVPLIVPNSLEPRYSYGGSKICSELIAFNYKTDAKVQIFRPHNIYGEDMGWKHVIPQFIIRILENIEKTQGKSPFKIIGNGLETRAFCYIDDLIDGLMIMENKGENRNIYNIGTNQEISIKDLLLLIYQHFKVDLKIETQEKASGATDRRCPDVTKMLNLGYQPKIDLKTGIERTINWYKHNTGNIENHLL